MAKTARGESQPQPAPVEVNEQNESPTPRPTEEEIATRAYYIYLERGHAEANPDDDWLQAERELIEGR